MESKRLTVDGEKGRKLAKFEHIALGNGPKTGENLYGITLTGGKKCRIFYHLTNGE